MIALPFILNALFNFVIGLLVAKFLGPSEYGRFALAFSAAIVVQTLCFDWLRLSATRFYSEQSRLARPEVRATLNVMFAIIASLVLLAAIAIGFSGVKLPLSTSLVALTVGAAITNGLFDFSAALVRSRFLDRTYGALVIVKNLLAISLTVGGAWYFGSAQAALVGAMLSVIGSLTINAKALNDETATPPRAERRLALNYASYALPIILANVLYQTVPMMNRGLVAEIHNFAEAGQLALAFETGIRIIGAIGTSADIFLFQLAVRAEMRYGPESARQRISANMGLVFAVVLAVVAGCWLVLPSFEHLFIPGSFRGAFAHYFTLMLPAMMAFALINYGVGPAFQISHRTLPLIICGLVGLVANWLAIMLLPASRDASTFAVAQSVSSCAALATMLIFLTRLEPMWPRARDLIGAILAAGAMILLVLPLRRFAPSVATLLMEAGAGACIYGFVAWGVDVAQLRSLLLPRAAAWLATRFALVGSGRSRSALD
jgi:O-antigen/teichoic acid export membrane protein